MPQHRPPRVISQPKPLRVAGVGENPRQGARRGVDLHVARSLTAGRFARVGAGLLTRCRRSTRRGGDRYRSGRGGQQKRGVAHSHWHGDVPYPSTCFARHSPGPAVLELPSAIYQPLRGRASTPTSRRSDVVRTGSNFPAPKAVRLQRWHQLESPSQPVSVVPASFTDALSKPLSPRLVVLQVVIPMLDSSSVQNGSMSMRLQAHRFAGTSCRDGTSAMSRASAIRSG
jgi:hypothetical protein